MEMGIETMKKRKAKRIIIYAILILLSVVMLFPFYWMIRSSFMTNREVMTVPTIWLPSTFDFDNYIEAFRRANFGRYFMNSIIIVVINVIGSVLSASFIGFGFSRLEFKGKNIWFALLLSTMMIPGTVLMIPQFIMWMKVGAYNTFVPLTLPCFFGNAFYVFLVRQFYAGIPKEYDEAALVDGANYFTIYTRISMPMIKPALSTVAVFTFMGVWNDFMGPLLYLDDENLQTISLALQGFIGQHQKEWNLLMALSTVISIPMIVIYFLAQKYFVEGITFEGLKG